MTEGLVEEFGDRVRSVEVDPCDVDVVEELDGILVEHSSYMLIEAAFDYARGAASPQEFEAEIVEESEGQGWFVDRSNRLAIERAGGDARDEAERAATDRFDEARCRAASLVWDALRDAELATERADLLSDAQRSAWRAHTGETFLTHYDEMTPDQQRGLCDLGLNTMAAGDANWGDRAESAFVDEASA